MTITAEQFTDCTKGRKGISCRSESKKGHQKKKEASRKEKLYLLNNSPQTKSNIFSVGEKEERRKLEGEKKKEKKREIPFPSLPLFLLPFLFSALVLSPPLHSVLLSVSP